LPAYALIADPDKSQAEIYRHIALAEGFDVQVVRDGDAALSLLRSLGAPALLITELSLARRDGFELLAELRKLASAESSPAVVVSAFRALRDQAMQQKDALGISAMLARTSPVESVRRAVKKALAGSPAPHKPARAYRAPAGFEPPEPTPASEERAEERRLQAIDEMEIVDEAPQEEALRQIVEETAKKFGVPIAAISLVLEDRQWFKAHSGVQGALLSQRGSELDASFCRHVVQDHAPLVIPDATVHPYFSRNRLVQEGAVRSYAGAPLQTPEGHVIGSLCIIDSKPMAISAEDVDQLVLLARLVAGELSLRSSAKQMAKTRALLGAAAPLPEFNSLSYLTAVMDNIDNGVLLLDANRTTVLANPALAGIFGSTIEAIVGRHRDDLLREYAAQFADPDGFLSSLRAAPQGPFALRGEFQMERPTRRVVRWVTKPVQLGEGVGHLTVVTDITAERDLERERGELSRTDPVTGLGNRRTGEEVMERESSRGQRFGSRVSLALFNLDLFAQVSERHGQHAGDEALRAVAEVIAGAVRGADIAVRWGGDELLAILPATGIDGAKSFGERVRARVEALEPSRGHGVTVSCGLAEVQPGEDAMVALGRASDQLAEAKEAGRNRVR
jgi:diguanylate cyclase (GGDEF)-like protein/PAS domain S-box-containing protein